jgi:hypothetical protein
MKIKRMFKLLLTLKIIKLLPKLLEANKELSKLRVKKLRGKKPWTNKMLGRGRVNRKNRRMETGQWLYITRLRIKLEMISTWVILQVHLKMMSQPKMIVKTKPKKVKRKKSLTPQETKLKSLELLKNYTI